MFFTGNPSKKQCFVIMPIGDQRTSSGVVTSAKLREKYDLLIREAILQADPALEVRRADDSPLPGSISNEILTRLMHSDFVVADITYANPNVLYELGIRHACRNGTVVIREESADPVPFDVSHQRYLQYENTPGGLRRLAESLRVTFDAMRSDPDRPDNQFQELAQLTKFAYPDYSDPAEKLSPELRMMLEIAKSPQLLDLMTRQSKGEKIDPADFVRAASASPSVLLLLAQASANRAATTVPEPPTHEPLKKAPRRNTAGTPRAKKRGKR